jgi:hypothetical protein
MVDIVKGIQQTCTILGYADDLVVVTSSKAPIRAETWIKEVANSVMRWASDNGFKISLEKTKTMLIHRRRPRTEGNTKFKLRVLVQVSTFKDFFKKFSFVCFLKKQLRTPKQKSSSNPDFFFTKLSRRQFLLYLKVWWVKFTDYLKLLSIRVLSSYKKQPHLRVEFWESGKCLIVDGLWFSRNLVEIWFWEWT